MLAAMQYELGKSPSVVTLVTADPNNLIEEIQVPEAWRSPGYQVIPLGFRYLGASWLNAIRATTLVFLLVGLWGWFACYRAILPATPLSWTIPLLLLAPWLVDALMTYESGDLFLFGVVPILILVNGNALVRQPDRLWPILAIVGGLLSTTIFLLKYSGIFVGIGMGLAWLILALKHRDLRYPFGLWLAGAAIGAGVILALGYPWGPSPSSAIGSQMRWGDGVLVWGAWPLAMSDTSEFVARVLKPLKIDGREAITVWAPAAGLLLLGILVVMFGNKRAITSKLKELLQARTPFGDRIELLMLSAFAMDTLFYSGIVLMGGTVDVCARIARPASLLMLPFVLRFLFTQVASGSLKAKTVAVVWLVVVFLPGPLIGASRVARFVFPSLMQYAASDEGSGSIRAQLLGWSRSEQDAFYAELRSYLPSKDTALFVISPDLLYPIPEQRYHLIYILDKGMSSEELAQLDFKGTPPQGIALLLPDSLEEDTRGNAFRSAFDQQIVWKKTRIQSVPGWNLWTSYHVEDDEHQDGISELPVASE